MCNGLFGLIVGDAVKEHNLDWAESAGVHDAGHAPTLNDTG